MMKSVGIMSYEKQKERLMAIARGEYKPGVDEPRIWFDNIQTMRNSANRLTQELFVVTEQLEQIENIDTESVAQYSLESRAEEIKERLKAIENYLRNNGE